MTTGIVICHDQLAFALLAAAEKIFGPAENVFAFSNDQLEAKSLSETIAKEIFDISERNMIIMVDLRGGSCWKAAKLLARDLPNIRILSGVNVPMLVSFLCKRNQFAFEELPEILAMDAHRGIVPD